jgi:predicted amidohydrolase
MAPSDRLHPFQEWLQAIAELTRAEARGVDDAERGRLSAEVDRARNAVALGVAP